MYRDYIETESHNLNGQKTVRTITRDQRHNVNPEQALELLKEGNKRFVNNLKANRNLLQQVNDTSEAQYPFAFILSCIDSRTSAELIFDQGLGDIFSCRIAGNILNDDILASMEFACKIAGAKIVVVLGHTNCGAIKGACSNVQLGNLTKLLDKIKPVVDQAKAEGGDDSDKNVQFVEHVASLNVKHVMQQVPEQSGIIREMLADNEITLVGGMYDVATGKVDFYE